MNFWCFLVTPAQFFTKSPHEDNIQGGQDDQDNQGGQGDQGYQDDWSDHILALFCTFVIFDNV